VESWPYKVTYGTVRVTLYKRKTPSGFDNFMLADDSTGKRLFRSFKIKSEAIAEADKLARKKAGLATMVQQITNAEAIEYFNSAARLKPFGVTVDAATATVAEALRIIGGFENMEKLKQAAAQGQPLPDLASLVPAAKFFRQRHKQVVKKTVPELVDEFLELKKARGASPRYLKDLHWRLKKMFAADCTKEAANVSTTDVQDWLDAQKLAPQNYRNFRTTLNTLFEHARARFYTFDNPVEGVEKIKVPKGGNIAIFTPAEVIKLLAAASTDFLPVIALGAFAGLRTAEIERLEWRDLDLAGGFIHVSEDKAKTASRRLVPILANLSAWLSNYAKRTGRVWQGTSNDMQDARAATVKASGVAWKDNGCRHSYISYRLAEIQDAAKVALEAGNSPNVVFKHYRELVKPSDAVKWFAVQPQEPANVLMMNAVAPKP
jgi:integrase